MNLEEMQRAVFDVLRQPLTPAENMRSRTLDGRSIQEIAESIIKPNDRLTSFERLEIYNRQYWFRILAALAEDFPGLRAIIGEKQFEKMSVAYLVDCPSESFTLRNLGARLETWLMQHLEFAPKVERLAVDMVRVEWADIASFDDPELPKPTQEDLGKLGEDPIFHLQPHVYLLDLAYPVDELLLSIRHNDYKVVDIVSNAVTEHSRRSRIKRSSLPKPEKVHLAVYRNDHSVYFKRLEPDAFALVRSLREGKPLSQAIEDSVNWSNQSLEHVSGQLHDWFANWSELGWFGKP